MSRILHVFLLLLRRPKIFKGHSCLRRQFYKIGQGFADIFFTSRAVSLVFGDTAFPDLAIVAVKKFLTVGFAAITVDLVGEDFGFVHPGPFSGGGFSLGVAVFQRCQAGIASGTIQTAIGNHLISPNESTNDFSFIYDLIQKTGGFPCHIEQEVSVFNDIWKKLSSFFVGFAGCIWYVGLAIILLYPYLIRRSRMKRFSGLKEKRDFPVPRSGRKTS